MSDIFAKRVFRYPIS